MERYSVSSIRCLLCKIACVISPKWKFYLKFLLFFEATGIDSEAMVNCSEAIEIYSKEMIAEQRIGHHENQLQI